MIVIDLNNGLMILWIIFKYSRVDESLQVHVRYAFSDRAFVCEWRIARLMQSWFRPRDPYSLVRVFKLSSTDESEQRQILLSANILALPWPLTSMSYSSARWRIITRLQGVSTWELVHGQHLIGTWSDDARSGLKKIWGIRCQGLPPVGEQLLILRTFEYDTLFWFTFTPLSIVFPLVHQSRCHTSLWTLLFRSMYRSNSIETSILAIYFGASIGVVYVQWLTFVLVMMNKSRYLFSKAAMSWPQWVSLCSLKTVET